MKAGVRYYTKSGNTKKLADAIAKAVGVEADTVDHQLEEDIDILFLGSSVYEAGVDDEVKKFIKEIHVKVGKVVNFSTTALLPSTYKQVSKLVQEHGLNMSEEEFHCRGSFAMMHRGKPDDKDIQHAAIFAKKMIHE